MVRVVAVAMALAAMAMVEVRVERMEVQRVTKAQMVAVEMVMPDHEAVAMEHDQVAMEDGQVVAPLVVAWAEYAAKVATWVPEMVVAGLPVVADMEEVRERRSCHRRG